MATRSCKRQKESKQVTKKKKETDGFDFLSDDLLLEIFKKFSHDFLRYKAKLVCKRWSNLITDRILFDHASLLLQYPPTESIRLIDIREEEQGGLITKEQNIKLEYNGRVISWCNEFLLVTYPYMIESLYIFNLITKQGLYLPRCSTSCGGHDSCKCGVSLSYDPIKRVYRVVHVFMGPPVQCEIIVLKENIISDKHSQWKKVKGPIYMGLRQSFWEDPVSIQGRYLHWNVNCSKYILSMDTTKERFKQTGLPDIINSHYSLMEMGGCLTLLHKVSYDRVNLWMLKNFERTKWKKCDSICISPYVRWGIFPRNIYTVPAVTSVKSKRYIVFKIPGTETGLYSYHLENKVLKRLEIDIAADERCVVHSTAGNF